MLNKELKQFKKKRPTIETSLLFSKKESKLTLKDTIIIIRSSKGKDIDSKIITWLNKEVVLLYIINKEEES